MSDAAVLLADFGASRVKAALYGPRGDRMLALAEEPAPSVDVGPAGEVEVDSAVYAPILVRLAEAVEQAAGATAGSCLLCAEMHGFALADADGRPLTRYISWRDERAVRDGTMAMLTDMVGDRFRAITGMRLRPGLPFVTLASLARAGGIPRDARLLTLPELIATEGDAPSEAVDVTMAAGTGLWDLGTGEWSRELLDVLRGLGGAPACGEVRRTGIGRVGSVVLSRGSIPLLGGLGDFQAALLGSQTPSADAVYVNIGTGSQVSRIGAPGCPDGVEERPFPPPYDTVCTITHIPAGRALRTFEALVDDVPGCARGRFWTALAAVTPTDIATEGPEVDLNVFAAAWRYSDGGSVRGIVEGGLTPASLATAIARALVRQYTDAISMIDPEGATRSVVLTGGLARRVGGLAEALGEATGRSVTVPAGGDETLEGLASLARGIAPGAPSQ